MAESIKAMVLVAVEHLDTGEVIPRQSDLATGTRLAMNWSTILEFPPTILPRITP